MSNFTTWSFMSRVQELSSSLGWLRHRNSELICMLVEVRDAIAALPEDALGVASTSDERYQWPIRDDLVSKIDRVLIKDEEK